MEITANAVKDLREKTGAGMMDCKKALTETQGDFEKAVVWLREKGMSQVAKRSGRSANQGAIASYVHGGKLGVLVEVNCETDFVAKTDDFQGLGKELAMQVAASSPKYVTKEEVPAAEVEQEKAIYLAEAKSSGKPEAVQQKIADGKIESYYKHRVPDGTALYPRAQEKRAPVRHRSGGQAGRKRGREALLPPAAGRITPYLTEPSLFKEEEVHGAKNPPAEKSQTRLSEGIA